MLESFDESIFFVDMNTLFDLTLASNFFPAWYLNWFFKFMMTMIVLNSLRFHIAGLICN